MEPVEHIVHWSALAGTHLLKIRTLHAAPAGAVGKLGRDIGANGNDSLGKKPKILSSVSALCHLMCLMARIGGGLRW